MTSRSCRFMLHNIRRIHPLLSQKASQVLVHALIIWCLDFHKSLLVGLPALDIHPRQHIQDVPAGLVFNQPQFSNTAQIVRTLVRTSLAPTGCSSLIQITGTFPNVVRVLWFSLHPGHGQTNHPGPSTTLFGLLLPHELRTDIRTAEILTILHCKLKTNLFKLPLKNKWERKSIL